MKFKIFSILFFCFSSFVGLCQVEEWKSITYREGLTDLQCFDVFSDSKGYIWVGNRAGVNRYDGKDVMKFNRSNGLMSDNVFSFFEDSQGRVWVNNLTGEPIFIKDGVVHNRITDPYLSPLKTDKFKSSIVEDKNGRLYFLVRDSKIMVLDENSVNGYQHDTIVGREDLGLYEQDGVLVIVCQYGIKVFDYDWNLLRENRWGKSIYGERSYATKDRIYIANDYSLMIYDLATLEKIEEIAFEEIMMVTDLRVINDKLHLSTSLGIYVLEDGVIKNDGYKYFSDLFVSAVDKGADGRIWVATREKGVFFESQYLIGESDYSNFRDVSYIEQVGKDSIYVGYDTRKLSLLTKSGMSPIKLGQEETFSILKTIKVENKLWVVSSLYLYNVEDDYKLNFYKRDGIYSEKYDKFYFPFHSGIKYLDNSNLSSLVVGEDKIVDHLGILKRIYFNQGYKCVNGSDGKVWVGAGDGLYTIQDTILNKVDIEELQGSVIDLANSGSDLIGINYGVGLFLYDSKKDKIKLMDIEGGLPSVNLTNLCISGDDIWVTHGLGVSHIRKSNGDINLVRNYGYEHGIPVGDITFIKYIDDKLHFVVDKKTYALSENLLYSDSLNITLDQRPIERFVDNEIIIDFDCVNYSFGRDVTYEYRLLPNDSIWKNTTDERITFQYLPANNYTLEVKAKHPLNLKSGILRKSINISERWYKTNWFFLLVFLILINVIWWLLRVGVLGFDSKMFKSILRKIIKDKKTRPMILKDIQGVKKLVNYEDIVYIKASGNYVEYTTIDEKIVVRATMKNTEKLIKEIPYLGRVHRSYIANLKRLKGISQNTIELDDYSIPYSTTYKEKLDDYVGYITS